MKIPVNYMSPQEALSIIQSNQRLFIHGSAHTPTYLLEHLAKEAYRLENVEIVSISVYGDLHVDKPEYKNNFHINSLFVSASVRNAVNAGYADYVPVFLSEIPELFRQIFYPLMLPSYRFHPRMIMVTVHSVFRLILHEAL